MAAIMGGPLFRRELDQLISAVQTLHEKHVDTSSRLLPAKRQRAVTEGDATNTASNSEPCTDPVDVLHDPDGSDSSLRPVCVTSFVQNEGQCLDSVSVMPQQLESASASHLLPPGSLQPHATQVPADHLPSLERFLTRYMLAPDKGQPMVVTGAMSAWPALTRWQDLAYLTRVAGARTVPVELGRHYLAQGWGQRLMLFSDFVKLHIQTEAAQAHIQTDALKPTTHVAQSQMQADRSERESTASRQAAKAAGALRVSASGVSSKQQQQHPESLPGESTCCAGEQASVLAAGSGAACCSAQDTQQMQAQPPNIQQTVSVAPKEAQRCQHVGEPQAAAETGAPMVNGDTVPQAVTGYLAQHPLFDQIPALRNDIQEPAYCVLGEGEVQSVNAWFGPAGTT
ncbi:hypothetical protein ABBQ32_010236 [Trebouxia sp. C0010 RCD-2024]